MHYLGSKYRNFPGPHTKELAKLMAKLFVYLTMSSPTRIIFLTNSLGSYHVDISNRQNDMNYSLLHSGMAEEVYASSKSERIDVMQNYKTLLKTRRPNVAQSEVPVEIKLKPEWFNMDVEDTIMSLKDKERSHLEQSFLESLQFSRDNKDPAKSFNEAKLLNI